MEQHETSQHRVLITGASKRVGRATALELARNGWDLVLTYRSSHRDCDETAEEAVRAARDASHSITVRVEHLDLADLESVQRLASVVVKQGSLDAIVHKAVEHTPTLIKDGVNPPHVDQKGAPHINTFLVFVPSVVVPAGFTRSRLPAGITFLGRPYDDAKMLRLAYAYEQATKHRKVPAAVG